MFRPDRQMLMRASMVAQLLCVAVPAQAEIYKCTDAQGKTQYSDAPCGDDATLFVPEAAPAPAGDAQQRMDKTQRLLRAYEAENAERQRAEAEARTAREQASRKCEQARNRLRFVTEARALYRLDEDGNRVVFSFEEREQSEQQARAEMERWCR
jgi:hypothetical protein